MRSIATRFATQLANWRSLVLPLLLLVGWQVLARRSVVYAYAFVPLEQVIAAARELAAGALWINLAASLGRTCAGLFVGATCGIAVGALMALSPIANRLIGPLYHAVRQVPLLGWAPLIGLWFGNSELAKLLVIFLAAFYPTVLNTFEGLSNVDKRYLELGETLNFNRRQRLARLLLPAALGQIFTGLMHALMFAWISAVGGEMLFSAGPGLGSMMLMAESNQRMDVVLVCVVAISVMGFVMNAAFAAASRYLLRWRV